MQTVQTSTDAQWQYFLNKLQWDLCFYFARRSNENINKFTNGTCKLMQHPTSSLRYVIKCYNKQIKNYQLGLIDVQTACIVEVRDSRYCPVKSFLMYKDHLSTLMDDLWQFLKTKNWQQTNVWYHNKKIDKNYLSAFMSLSLPFYLCLMTKVECLILPLSHDKDLSKMYEFSDRHAIYWYEQLQYRDKLVTQKENLLFRIILTAHLPMSTWQCFLVTPDYLRFTNNVFIGIFIPVKYMVRQLK